MQGCTANPKQAPQANGQHHLYTSTRRSQYYRDTNSRQAAKHQGWPVHCGSSARTPPGRQVPADSCTLLHPTQRCWLLLVGVRATDRCHKYMGKTCWGLYRPQRLVRRQCRRTSLQPLFRGFLSRWLQLLLPLTTTCPPSQAAACWMTCKVGMAKAVPEPFKATFPHSRIVVLAGGVQLPGHTALIVYTDTLQVHTCQMGA